MIVATYQYQDKFAGLLYEVVREEFPDKPKTFHVRRPAGNGGFVNGLGDVSTVCRIVCRKCGAPFRIGFSLPEGKRIPIDLARQA